MLRAQVLTVAPSHLQCVLQFPADSCVAAGELMAIPLQSTQINSFIRGYHVYKEDWAPTTGEQLILRREPSNPKDHYAVSVLKEEQIVGHVPFNISNTVSQFLRRAGNTGFAEVTGHYVNQGADYGVTRVNEVTCSYLSKLQQTTIADYFQSAD